MTQTLRLTPLDLDRHPQGWIRLVWSGEVDAHSVQPLLDVLRTAWEEEPLVLEVDLGGVTFLDSAGLRPLVEAHARLGDRVRLFDPSPAVTRLLQVLGLQHMFITIGPLPNSVSEQSAEPRPQHWSSEPGPDTSGQRPGAPPAAGPGLHLSTDDRATVEQAKGLLMAINGCDAPSAWEILRGHAKTHDVSIRVMARMLVDRAPNDQLPMPATTEDDIRAELARSVPPA